MPNAFGGDQSDADYAPHLNTEKKKKIVHPVKEKMYSKEEILTKIASLKKVSIMTVGIVEAVWLKDLVEIF